MGIVAQNTQRVMVMYAGQLVEEGSTTALFGRRLHPYTEALLGCVPRLDASLGGEARLTSIPGSPPDLARLGVGCRFAPRCPSARDHCVIEAPTLSSPEPGRSVQGGRHMMQRPALGVRRSEKEARHGRR